MKHIIDTDELEKIKVMNRNGDLVIYYDDLIKALANSPQADGMVLVPVTISRDGKEFRLISNNYGTVSDISLELKVYFDASALSAYKPQADEKEKL